MDVCHLIHTMTGLHVDPEPFPGSKIAIHAPPRARNVLTRSDL